MSDIPSNLHNPSSGEIRKPAFTVETGEAMAMHRGEDRVLVDPERLNFAVADGMGGHGGGALAAEIAIDTLGRVLNDPLSAVRIKGQEVEDAKNLLIKAFVRAQHDVTYGPDGEWQSIEDRHPGSTLSAVSIVEQDDTPHVIAAGIGDSPIMLIRGDSIETLVKVDSAVEDSFIPLILEQAGLHFTPADIADIAEILDDSKSGPDAWARLRGRFTDTVAANLTRSYFRDRYMITSGLGVGGVEHAATERLQDGDIIMIASDGITDPLTTSYIRDIVASRNDLDDTAQALVDAARSVPTSSSTELNDLKRGKKDDASVILIRIKIEDKAEAADDLEQRMRAEIEWSRGEQTPEFWAQKTSEVTTVRKAFASIMAELITSGHLLETDLDQPEDAIKAKLGSDHEFVRLGHLLSDLVDYILEYNPSLRGANPDRVYERIEQQMIQDIAVIDPFLADKLEGPPSE